jgi:hypothetical protein
MVYLQKCASFNFRFQVRFGLATVEIGELAKRQQLVIIDVRSVLLGEEISEHQNSPAFARTIERNMLSLSRFLKTPPPGSSACPRATWRIAFDKALSDIRAFFAALANHAVLNTRSDIASYSTWCYI